ncbi:hypothetical protein L9F63_019435, partial [Diploptera punctata]
RVFQLKYNIYSVVFMDLAFSIVLEMNICFLKRLRRTVYLWHRAVGLIGTVVIIKFQTYSKVQMSFEFIFRPMCSNATHCILRLNINRFIIKILDDVKTFMFKFPQII